MDLITITVHQRIDQVRSDLICESGFRTTGTWNLKPRNQQQQHSGGIKSLHTVPNVFCRFAKFPCHVDL